jgi:uncharacterized heparinase superfamily protein
VTLAAVTAQLHPNSVFCMVERHHRDLERAELVCSGRFPEVGRTLDLGVEPDWLGAALPVDDEWRIAWVKFYYGLDLAHAFRTTGEERFLVAWERLVRSYIRQVPVDRDSADVAARRVQNWVYAWDLFAQSPSFPGLHPGLADELLDNLAAQTRFIRDNLTPARNHRTLELYALYIVALAFPQLEDDLLDFAVGELHRNLMEEMRPDGVHIEQSTHYHLIVLRSFVGARENARRFGLTLPDGFDEQLSRALDFAMHCHRPDGGIPAFSDADAGDYRDLLALAADLLDRDDLRYVATAGAEGRPPAERHVSFPDGGYHIQRSGWGNDATAFADERFLMLDCGPLGAGGHGHYDLLSFELAAGGRPLIMDPGRYTYSETPEQPGDGENPRHWFKGTAAHNTVVVDGRDQSPYARSKPRGRVAEGQLVSRLTGPGVDVLHAEATSPCYDAVHTRRVAFVADEYWLIEDRLWAPQTHRYELRFHLAPEAQDAVTIARTEHGWSATAPGLALIFDGDREPVVEPGWVSPEYGVKVPAPVVSVSVSGAANAAFTTLVVPLAEGAKPPTLRTRRRNGTSLMTVSGAARDRIAWTDERRPLTLGPLECRAGAAFLREHEDGRPPVLRACRVSDLRLRGSRSAIFTAGEPVAWVAWVGDDEEPGKTVTSS